MRRSSSYCLIMPNSPASPAARVVEATKRCCEQWGFERVTIDDIAAEAKVSRATIYRLFPGGKDVLFEALRVQELEDFFNRLLSAIDGARSLDDVLVGAVASATVELRHDDHLAIMLATAPGETLGQLAVTGLPRIIRVATVFLTPLVEPYLSRESAGEIVELLVRLVISAFLAPSERVDFGQVDQARAFLRTFVLPAYADELALRNPAHQPPLLEATRS
jgi:AcrR family transcriptional regulator